MAAADMGVKLATSTKKNVIISFVLCTGAGASEIAARIDGPPKVAVEAELPIAIVLRLARPHKEFAIISFALCTETGAAEIAARVGGPPEAGSKRR